MHKRIRSVLALSSARRRRQQCDLIVLDLTVRHETEVRVARHAGQTESSEGQSGHRVWWYRRGQMVRAVADCLVDKDLFAQIGPVAVGVEVHPGVQHSPARNRRANGHGDVATCVQLGKRHSIVVRAIASGGCVRLTNPLPPPRTVQSQRHAGLRCSQAS